MAITGSRYFFRVGHLQRANTIPHPPSSAMWPASSKASHGPSLFRTRRAPSSPLAATPMPHLCFGGARNRRKLRGRLCADLGDHYGQYGPARPEYYRDLVRPDSGQLWVADHRFAFPELGFTEPFDAGCAFRRNKRLGTAVAGVRSFPANAGRFPEVISFRPGGCVWLKVC
jgi:hypothetical protein